MIRDVIQALRVPNWTIVMAVWVIFFPCLIIESLELASLLVSGRPLLSIQSEDPLSVWERRLHLSSGVIGVILHGGFIGWITRNYQISRKR